VRARPAILLLTLLALAGSYVSGCARTANASSGDATSTVAEGPPLGDVDRGREVFTLNCATCHGATGTEGGVGPSLRDERARKNYDDTIAWIENPLPPMPKLYPSPLSREAVDDVAAYVQSL
jgi:mono/diheme cytochrome c family protein